MRRALSLSSVVAFCLVLLCGIGPAGATEYRFHVSCSDKNFVVVWRTGDVDPGREYLRTATGMKNANCSISDYNQATDERLPVDIYEGGEAVIYGFPPVSILCGIFGC